MLNIALFGPPGAGKGTQSKHLVEKYNLTYISTGDILRQEIAEGTELGLKAKSIIDAGGLVDDEIIVQIIERKIITTPDTNGILFDGFPRTVVQAYILEGLLLKLNTSLTCMLSLEVPHDELMRRMLERAKVSGRSDDKVEVINRRLEEYETKTAAVADFYKEKKKYYPIQGVGNIDEVFGRLDTVIQNTLSEAWLNVVLHGYPGAGKGTQAKILAEKYNLVYISTGEMLRQEIANDTEYGRIVAPYMEKGDVVPDEIAIRLIERKIKKNPDARGFIFKGFPMTIVQGYILDGLLRRMGSSVSRFVELEVNPLECIKRLSARAKTDKARSYDVDTDIIIRRLETHEQRSSMIADYFNKQGKHVKVNGLGEDEEVSGRIGEIIERAFRDVR